MTKHALTVTRDEDFPEWYQEVVRAADLAENSEVRGCMVIKPWGYGIWESISACSTAGSRRPATRTLLPAVHPAELPREGSRARRRLRQGDARSSRTIA